MRGRWIVVPLALLATLAVGMTVRARQDPGAEKRSQFMRLKLEYSKGIVEGLALENYDLILKNSQALKRLSMAAEWEVPTIPDVENYIPYTVEFQRATDQLSQEARDKDIDGATLAYMKVTMTCVSCHKYVRRASK